MMFQRLIALIIMAIPIIIAAYGWKFMRDALFSYFSSNDFLWGSFLLGLILFLGGIGFIAGFIFHRDKKRHLTQPGLFKKKKKKRVIE